MLPLSLSRFKVYDFRVREALKFANALLGALATGARLIHTEMLSHVLHRVNDVFYRSTQWDKSVMLLRHWDLCRAFELR